MDSKLLVTRTHAILKEMGHEIPLGHVYEVYSKLAGYKSWNVAKNKKDAFKSIVDSLDDSPQEDKNIRLANNALAKLIVDSKDLPSAYQSIGDYLTDWLAELPWNIDGQKVACNYLLTQKDFIDTCDFIKKKYNYDLYSEIKKGTEYTVESNEAVLILNKLENYISSNPSKEDFDTFIEKWFYEISPNWDGISDREASILVYIKADKRFKGINDLINEKYGGNYLSVIDDIVVDF